MAKRKTFIKSLASLLLAFVAMTASAQNEAKQYLLVTENSGTETAFALADSPVITLADGQMTVTAGSQTITVAIADVADYKFVTKEDIPSAIDNVDAGSRTELSLTGGRAYVSGLEPGARVSVYTVSGVQVAAVKASADGTATVELGALKRGEVYILRTPATSYKVLNK